jgi:hypothetical protein
MTSRPYWSAYRRWPSAKAFIASSARWSSTESTGSLVAPFLRQLVANLPKKEWIATVLASRYDEGTVYVAQQGRYDEDFAVRLYKSTDYGKSFRSISSASAFPAFSWATGVQCPWERFQ